MADDFGTVVDQGEFGTVVEDKPGPVGKTVSALGRGLAGAFKKSAEFLSPSGILGDPYLPKTPEELRKKTDFFMEIYKNPRSTEKEKQTALGVIYKMNRRFETERGDREIIEDFKKSVDKAMTLSFNAYDPRYQPKGFVESVAYGIVEFLPEAPVYEFVGGPASAYVDAALSGVLKKYGPQVASDVAQRLGEALYQKGKAYLAKTATEATGAGAGAAYTELAAGKKPAEIALTGIEFAGASAVFRVFGDTLRGLARAASKKPPGTPEGPPKPAGYQEPLGRAGEQFTGDDVVVSEKPLADPHFHSEPDFTLEEKRALTLSGMYDTAKRYLSEQANLYTQMYQEWRQSGKNIPDFFEDWKKKHPEGAPPIDPRTGTISRKHPYFQEQKKTLEILRKAEEEVIAGKTTEEKIPLSNDPQERIEEHHPQTPEVEAVPFFEDAFRSVEARSPALQKMFTATRKFTEQMKEWLTIDGVPIHRKFGLTNEAFDLAFADQVTPRVVDDMVAKVLGPHYADPISKKLITQFFLKDRIVATHEADKALLAEMKARQEQISREKVTAEENILYFNEQMNKAGSPEEISSVRVKYDEQVIRRKELLDEEEALRGRRDRQERLIEEQLEAHPIETYRIQVERAWNKNAVELWTRSEDPFSIVSRREHPERMSPLELLQKKWHQEGRQLIEAGEKPTGDMMRIEGDEQAFADMFYRYAVKPIQDQVFPYQLRHRVSDIKGIAERWKREINPYLDRMYRDRRAINPNVPIDTRGQYGSLSGVNIRLIHKDVIAPGKPGKAPKEHQEESLGVSRGTAHAAKSDRDFRATATGEYTTWLEKNLTEAIKDNNLAAARERYYRAAEARGIMVAQDSPSIPLEKALPEGVKWVLLQDGPVKRPVSDQRGNTEYRDKYMFVRSDARREARGILDIDPKEKANVVARALTYIQLKQLADFVVHGKNLLSEVVRSQGKGENADVLTRLPLIGHVHAVRDIQKTYKDVVSDSPEIRGELRELAEMGVLRKEHGADDIVPTAHILWQIDSASRLLLNRYYKNLAREGKVPDTLEARRDYVNQVGMYNERLMGSFTRRMRRSGLSPFVVAGRTFNRQAIRWASGYSGVRDAEGENHIRLLNQSGVIMAAVLPMMLNTLTTGNPAGREGTQLLAWDLGLDDRNGKHMVIDVGQWTGLSRFRRIFGIDALEKGIRGSQTAGQIAKRAGRDIARGITHPFTGPAVSFAENMLEKDPVEAGAQLNPLAAVLGPPRYGTLESIALEGSGGKNTILSRTARYVDELLKSPKGAAGWKEVRPPQTAMTIRQMELRRKYTEKATDESAMLQHIRLMAQDAFDKHGDEGMRRVLQENWDNGNIHSIDWAKTVWRDRELNDQQRGFKSLSPGDAIEAYKLGNPQEKAKSYSLLARKIQAKKGKDDRYEEWYSFVESARDELLAMIDAGIVSERDVYHRRPR